MKEDDGEFVAFVERQGSRLCDTAFWLCGDWSLAQDLTQTTLVKVYLAWRRIKHDNPYPYCKQVLLRTYLDHKRLKSSAEVQIATVPDRPAAADVTELRVTLLDALGHLSPRDRAIVVLRYWEDHSIQTVAELLGLSPGVVKTRSMRALDSLRDLLGDDEPLLDQPSSSDTPVCCAGETGAPLGTVASPAGNLATQSMRPLRHR
jgi:RNA polymerase sigma-70 factor (sigma-E family)